jgi:heme/copper-type cytochrome/quinol oxidase subunit 3
VLFWGAVLTWRGGPLRDRHAWSAAIGHCRTFWHFLLLVWIYLFAFVSVV